jgi:phosphonate transport system substrate-binding protein
MTIHSEPYQSNQTLILGAVAYDPKVVTIWDGFRTYFARHSLDFDYVLFSNYERQVRAHFEGLITVAWNSPLAWLQSESIAAATGRKVRALCMRDTDCDLVSLIVVRAGDSSTSRGGGASRWVPQILRRRR